MSDQQFPGFEDDPKPKKKPAAPAPPAPAPPPAAAPTAANYEFEESAPAPKRKAPAMPLPPPTGDDAAEHTPATMHPVLPEKRAAPSPAPSEPEDPDVKPGSRKDLWACPHCGTGNKPDRSTCRKCGKSPDDEIEKQWYQKPQILGGIVGGVLLFILLIMFVGGTDLSVKPADADHIDGKVRIGGSASATHDFDTRTFTAKKRLAVVGRCIGVNQIASVPGAWTVVLLLGSAARNDDAASSYTIAFNGERADITPDSGNYKVIHLLPGTVPKFDPRKGSIISIAGESGEMDGVGGYGELVVWLEEFAQE
jgi:hypothetical protein